MNAFDATTTDPPLLGPPVDATPSPRPGPVALEGRYGRVERLETARHAAALWAAMRDQDRLWVQIPYGPFDSEAAFGAWVEERERWYVSFPPFPAILMMPFVAVFGLSFNDVAFTLFFSAATSKWEAAAAKSSRANERSPSSAGS